MSNELDEIFGSVEIIGETQVTQTPEPEPALMAFEPDPSEQIKPEPSPDEPTVDAVNPSDGDTESPSDKPCGRPTWMTVALFCVIAFMAGLNISGCPQGDRRHGDDSKIIDDESEGGVVIGDEVKLVVLRTLNDESKELSVLMRNKNWLDSLVERKIDFVSFHDGQDDIPTIKKAAEGKQRPTVLIVVDGKVVMATDFPTANAEKEIDKLLKQKTGR